LQEKVSCLTNILWYLGKYLLKAEEEVLIICEIILQKRLMKESPVSALLQMAEKTHIFEVAQISESAITVRIIDVTFKITEKDSFRIGEIRSREEDQFHRVLPDCLALCSTSQCLSEVAAGLPSTSDSCQELGASEKNRKKRH
jgi:hypothetical protein